MEQQEREQEQEQKDINTWSSEADSPLPKASTDGEEEMELPFAGPKPSVDDATPRSPKSGIFQTYGKSGTAGPDKFLATIQGDEDIATATVLAAQKMLLETFHAVLEAHSSSLAARMVALKDLSSRVVNLVMKMCSRHLPQ